MISDVRGDGDGHASHACSACSAERLSQGFPTALVDPRPTSYIFNMAFVLIHVVCVQRFILQHMYITHFIKMDLILYK